MNLEFKSVVNQNGNEFVTEYTTQYTEDTRDEFIVLKFKDNKNNPQIIQVSKNQVLVTDNGQEFDFKLKKYVSLQYKVQDKFIQFYTYLRKVIMDVDIISFEYDLVDSIQNKNILATTKVYLKTK